jgi:RNA polymerase sigma-70 factor (ECF subfamily)
VETLLQRCDWFVKAARSPHLRPSPSLESELRQLYQAGLAAWPTVQLPEDSFVRHLAARCAGSPKDLHTVDLYLACACERRDREAIRILEEKFLSHLAADLVSLRPTPELVAEVRQQLLTKFIIGLGKQPKIATYSGRGPLKSWVRAAALRTAINQRAKEDRDAMTSDAALLEAAFFEGAELHFFRDCYRGDFTAAVASSLERLSKRDRNVLRLFYLGGMSLEQLSVIYGVHRVSVSRWLSASRAAILKLAREALGERLHLSPSELESVFRLMRDEVDVSVSRLLQGSQDN